MELSASSGFRALPGGKPVVGAGLPPSGSPPARAMPGRWVGGKGSIAAPTKDLILEGKAYTDDGDPRGTVLVRVKRIYAPGALGRFFLGDYISASDKEYRAWTETKKGRVTTVDGSYHLCKTAPGECTATGQHSITAHLGQWRVWKEAELLAGQAPEGYNREAKGLITRYLKRGEEAAGKPADSGLPWSRQGVLDLKKKRERSPDEKPGSPKEKEPKDRDRAAKVTKITELEKKLKELKKELREEDEPEKAAKRKQPASAKDRGRSKKKVKTFDKGGLGTGDPNEMGADWGSVEESSEKGSSDESMSETSSKRPKEKKRKRRTESESDQKEKKGRKDKKRGRHASPRKKKKRRNKRNKLDRDKGPFGVGETSRLPKGKSGSEDSEGSSSTGSSQSFRKAPSGLTLHLRLQRYAQRYPGRLATRLLEKMERATRFEGAINATGQKMKAVRPCAVNYFLTILAPSLKDRWTARTQREMRVGAEILDCLAAGKGSQAADIQAQRLKALEQSVQDANSWKKAKFLELVAEDTGMTDKGEEHMMSKELELEEKFKGKPQAPSRWEEGHTAQKGKDGKGSGKAKGRGKWKTPAQEAVDKKGA